MTFVNGIMALGAAAFVVPLVIHLLFRSRYRSMDWGAMFLLQDVVRANRRRMQWHQWILLALRCAIPILLALAMARPLISSVQSLAGKQPVSLVVMVDDSRSMSAGMRSTRAVDGVIELLDSMSRGDEVILIPASELSAPVSIGSAVDAKAKLKELRFDGGAMDLAATLRSAASACRQASNPYRRIVVVSDFQDNTLRRNGGHDVSDGEPTSSSILGAIDSIEERFAQFDPRPQVDFLDVGETDDETASMANVVVESVRVDVPAILVGHDVPIEATIRNDSDLPVTNLRANWMVDGRTFNSEIVAIEPRGTVSLKWQTNFDTPGGASVGLAIEHTDVIAADNRREYAIDVLHPIRVWLVDGDPSIQPLQSETDFLKVALSPFAFRSTTQDPRRGSRAAESVVDPRQRDVVSTKVLTTKSLDSELGSLNLNLVSANQAKGKQDARATSKLAEDFPDLIVFANVARPPSYQSKTRVGEKADDDPVDRYLAAGGHVLFFDGDRVDADAWSDCDWLPAAMKGIRDAETKPFRIEPPGARVGAWRALGSDEDSLFDSVAIGRRRELVAKSDAASVLLRTEAGEPLAVTHWYMQESDGDETGKVPADDSDEVVDGLTVHQGRVVQFAFPCDTAWSNLPLRPVFLPMLQQLVLEMVGDNRQGNIAPGTPMIVRPDREWVASGQASVWQVTTPDGSTRSLSTSAEKPLVYRNTNRVGAYRFGIKPTAEMEMFDADDAEAPAGSFVNVRVVEVPAAESELRRAAPELLAECVERLKANRYEDAGGLVAAAQHQRFGTEVWRPLLWLLLAIMVTEILWQQLGVTKSANRFAGANAGAVS
ncbi:BatA domain-containing protein [Aporhodopirellula aestuarii]|uniref:BatA domain-containing protein n=1 Tax=Aporhodopirellula aestuarii TaxID=2950107 RepID=A0ABT0UDD0_9BACT|nr:BatA domain-containing protein [Aporhodopirellula aestuarii]MCM2375052.1 BatA domain-containing protein [Aporhodopirellula aestuarii]